MRLLPPILTLLVSLALLKVGLDVWNYRHVPAKWITDPTSFKIAALFSAAIIIPAVLGVLLSLVALVQRLARKQAIARRQP